MYTGEEIKKAQAERKNNILKSFGVDNFLEKSEEVDIEKAHQDGDMHPNGKWVWRSSANGGKGDWRVANPKRGGAKSTSVSSSSKSTATKKEDNDGKKSDLKKKLDESGDSSVVKISNSQTGNPVITYTKKDGNWYSKNTMTRGEVKATTEQMLKTIENYNKKTYSIKIDLVNAKKAEKPSYESKSASDYDKGDGKIGNYAVPTHTSYSAANLYNRLKNNRHFGFKYGLPDEEIMKKLKDYEGNVKVSEHKNAGSIEIYRIKFV